MNWPTACRALCIASLVLVGSAVLADANDVAPSLELVPWNDSLLPPSFLPEDDPRTLRGLPPDSLDEASRPPLPVSFAEVAPSIDGDLADWPVVRWKDLRGARTLVRGDWTGTADAALDFALLWTPDGLVLGARLVDDSLDVDLAFGAAPGQRVESVLLYVGSSSPVVQRYWRSAERAFRVWGDGRLEAWTRYRNRRPALFDPSLLGVRCAVQGKRRALGGELELELFVPWGALFPALPHDEAGLLLNVLVEDVDGGREKLLAWATRPTTTASGSMQLGSTWARFSPQGGPREETWILSSGTGHLEAGFPCEWSLLRLAAGEAPEPLELAVGVHGERPQRVTVPGTPALLRYEADFSSSMPWPRQRLLELDVGPWRQEPWRHDVFHRAPTPASFVAGAREVGEAQQGPVFPRPADVAVRLEQVAGVVEALGDWRTVRYTDRGILASRAVAWAGIERRLLECQMLRDLMLGDSDDPSSEHLVNLRWPERTAAGIPMAKPLLRGIRSDLDGSFQPYGLYVPRAASLGRELPLLVVLHDFDETALTPFEDSRLVEAVEERGWIVLSPYGRGNTGFALAGERDVLDVLEQVRRDLPVDGRRLFVMGRGMGGTGAWLLSTRHGALFAGAAVVTAYADMDQQGLFQILGYRPEELFFFETMNPARLLRPGLETAYRVVHAERDPGLSVVHARIMKEKLEEYGLAHEVLILPTEQSGPDLFAAQLEENLEFLSRQKRRAAGTSEPAWFQGSGGPVASVFSRGPFAVVHGTRPLSGEPLIAGADSSSRRAVTGVEADARAAQQVLWEWETHFDGEPPRLDDTRLDASLLRESNLVLVGEPRTLPLLERVAADLPVRYDGDRFIVEGQWWSFAKAGILYATPNPEAPERSWVVVSGMAERLGGFKKSLLKLGADYVIVNDRQEILAIGHFHEAGDTEATPR
jgi:hypothetical protein